jgi:hypothetical protein
MFNLAEQEFIFKKSRADRRDRCFIYILKDYLFNAILLIVLDKIKNRVS